MGSGTCRENILIRVFPANVIDYENGKVGAEPKFPFLRKWLYNDRVPSVLWVCKAAVLRENVYKVVQWEKHIQNHMGSYNITCGI